MKLQRLQLSNFKGVRSFEFMPDGRSVSVYGQNASGKTTVADAVTFLLFDKDTQDKSPAAFGIKTLDESGNPLSGLEHTVEAEFSLGNEHITLRKVYAENWTKRRGSSTKELTGHTTSYYWDDEPVSQKEYKERISEIMPEQTFKMLTLPNYFAEIMHWKERREILTELCGEIRDEDIIAADPDLEGYADLLNGKGQEAREKILKERKKKLNHEIDNIPSRIDELTNLITEVEIDPQALEVLKNKKADLEEKLSMIRAGGGVAELQVKAQEIEAKKAEFINGFKAMTDEGLKDLRKKVSELEGRVDESSADLRKATRDYQQVKHQVEVAHENAEELAGDIEAAEEVSPDPRPDTLEDCPMCGQKMPEQNHDGHYEEYLKDFNAKKAERVKRLKEEFSQAEEEIDGLHKELDEKEKVGAQIRARHKQREEALVKAQAELRNKKDAIPSAESQQPYKDLEAQKDALLSRVNQINSERKSQTDEVQNQIHAVEEKIEEHNKAIHQDQSNRQYRERINELRSLHKKYGQELIEVEDGLNLIESFNRAKAEYITERVNEKFELVRWRLFKEQINGGIDECCDAVIDGVPYSEGLNNAARVQAGLDIIETLSKHYSKSAPVWIDNRESVTELPETDLQIISLIVSPSHKRLTVEAEQKKLQVA